MDGGSKVREGDTKVMEGQWRSGGGQIGGCLGPWVTTTFHTSSQGWVNFQIGTNANAAFALDFIKHCNVT